MSASNRRQFLKGALVSVSGLSLGFGLTGCGNGEGADIADAARAADVTAWLSIGADESIIIRVPSSEMGQGVHTSLPMIVAEELDANWENVQSETAPVTAQFVNPLTGSRGTGGSSAVRRWWPTIALAGATARQMLVNAAAESWGVDAADLSTDTGVVYHRGSNRQASYGALATLANKLPIPNDVQVKNPNDYSIIGKRAQRLDSPAKVDGSAQFGIDVVVPGMVYATVAASPNFVGKLENLNESAALAINGVERVVTLLAQAQEAAGVQSIVSMPDAVAVVASSYWRAQKGLQALAPIFGDGGVAALSDETLRGEFASLLSGQGANMRSDGSVSDSLAVAKKIIEADFTVPFLAHLCMEPMNCTAHYSLDARGEPALEIWAPTQGESHTLAVLQKALGLALEQITLHTTLMGGAFGRRYEADFVLQAALISKAVLKPVKLLWSREEDVQHDYYRPMSASRFKVGLDAAGLPISWSNHVVATSVAKRNFSAALVNGSDPFSVEGAVNIPYAIPNQSVTLTEFESTIPSGSWRSVGSSHNGFYVESMMDEIASVSGRDPFELRRALLTDKPRFLAVLDTLEAESNWNKPLPKGHFRGMAIHECFASIVAEVAEISLGADDKIKVERMTCVVDCGRVVNPDIVEQQMEGAMIDGITAALWGGISIESGKVVQANFDSYRMMRLGEVPEMRVHIMANEEAPGGIGEPGVPPSMPALANALFAANGVRVRSLPIEQAS
ncbi:molybdopterin-dependent oxidoreductase [Gammaproteobacteria bacterium]|jgi:isoquinoline 1-oxidoreductase beta subunit|nr:molybdopterin-dependent oxidoreductase [Gammaproteobacteria bacterium]